MPPLDLTPYVRAGENSIKIAQIGNAEDYIFFLPVIRPVREPDAGNGNTGLQALFRPS
jgi:hypothetical protein